ncbi:MAG: prepilin-type N-terminal cleavage/methylation domain-containing protein [Anaerostipes sp.]|nr:prepilin-type N-terminal cleavage/methylation domain-containing protein [Anaerostipes sp.]MDD3745683.1 prepilin-type N-terminal cleavage/methylation domain-containing protein [Anaerostipes sp.]
MLRMNPKKSDKNGFTLVELIVVLLILGILVALLVPALTGYIDRARASDATAKAKQVETAAKAANAEWYGLGQPGNSDNAYKTNMETLIVENLDGEIGNLLSFTKATDKTKNVVQVAFSPQGGQWDRFRKACKENGYKNFVQVWMHKVVGNLYKIDKTIDAVYYISEDGNTAVRMVFSKGTKLGDVGVDWTDMRTY